MQPHEQTQFLQAVGSYVREQIAICVESATQPLRYRINQLEMFIQENTKGLTYQLEDFDKRLSLIPAGKDGRDGVDGKNGESGKDGIDGANGRDIDMDIVADVIQETCKSMFDAVPKPVDGKDGKDGRDGIDGKDGKDGAPGVEGLSVDADSVNAFIKVCVDDAVARIPVPAVPINVVGGFIDRDGNLCHTLSDGTIKVLGMVVGRDGKNVAIEEVEKIIRELFVAWPKPKDGLNGKDGIDGKDGKDGLGFDDFSVEYINENLYLVFKRGDISQHYLLPHIHYRGIWREGKYQIGDQVTWDGSQFIALRETETKPGTKDNDWQLCVKKGRDGKDGKNGEQGPIGPMGKPGRDGRDLTQLAFDGTKS